MPAAPLRRHHQAPDAGRAIDLLLFHLSAIGCGVAPPLDSLARQRWRRAPRVPISGLLIGRAAQALLFGLEFDDPGVIASSILVLVLVAAAAGFVPAMRALKYE
jgi:hypothetical protein